MELEFINQVVFNTVSALALLLADVLTHWKE